MPSSMTAILPMFHAASVFMRQLLEPYFTFHTFHGPETLTDRDGTLATLMRLHFGFMIVLACSACALRPGMNATCDWPPDRTPSSDVRHLVADVRIAEELAIRYADAAGKLSPDWRGRLDSCTEQLFASISATHRVPVEAVTGARAARPSASSLKARIRSAAVLR
jgi:hypothetical protein